MFGKSIIIRIFLLIGLGVFVSSAGAVVWTDPNSFDVNIVEGRSETNTLTIGNNGVGGLNFTVRTRVVGSSGAAVGIESLSGEGLVLSGSQSQNFPNPGGVQHKSDELIVRFASKAAGIQLNSAEKLNVMSTISGATIKKEFTLVPGLSVVKLPKGMTVETAIQNLSKTSGVLYAHANYQVQALSTFPNDPRFNELWGMHNTGQSGGKVDADIDAPEAWDIGTGSREVVVAVIDTGVDYTHPDLAANMWVNQAELNGTPGVDDDHNGYVDDIYGYDFVNNDGDPWDDHFHGTHCSGTIGALGNNAVGVAGVCWNVKIMALKFLDSSGSGWTDDAIRAVEYSRQMGAKLSSNSWGGGGYSQGLKDAIDAAGAAGMLFVAAAGNSGSDNDTDPHYPSSYTSPSVIAVMATDNYDNKSSFSCYGLTSVDIGAPGSNILSCQPGGGYQYLSGTSMATPHVSGACALLWSMNPSLSNSEVKDILLRTVDPTLSGLCVSGGRLNLYKAVCETAVPWITIDPNQGTIGPGQSTGLSVTFDAIDLTPGTYRAQIIIASNDPCSPAVVPVTMIVNPDALRVSPAGDFESSGSQGGPFIPAFKTYTLTNNSSVPVNWTTFPTAGWVTISPSAGVLSQGASVDVNVFIDANANALDPNVYFQDLVFQNIDSGSIKTRSAKLSVKPPDLFTKLFSVGTDLTGLSITFRPIGSIVCYEACRDDANAFSVDPNGGTYLPLGDDDFAEVLFTDGKQFRFYDQSYDRFYVGSNGYITFGAGDDGFEGSLANHFSLPRISGFFTDLTPANSQGISVKQLADRVAVTYIDVPVYGDKTSKTSFQIELFFADGSIRVTWLKLPATAGVAGLSKGHGLPPEFEESNFREYPICWPFGDFDRNYTVDLADLAIFVANWLKDDCGYPMWCDRADMDYSSTVDGVDFSIFAGNWRAVKSTMPSPVAYWKFDEGTGTVAYDSAGSNDGNLINGPTWTAGIIGGCLTFDGINDYVSVNDDSTLDIASAITITAWIKLNNISNYNFIVTKGPSGSAGPNYAGNYEFIVELTSGRLQFLHQTDSGTAFSYYYSSTALSTGVWYHVAVALGNGQVSFYIDGSPAGTATQSGTFGILNNEPVRIGTRKDYNAYFNGSIDDVRIYNKALSKAEIWQLYQEGLSKKASSPNPADKETSVDSNVILSWTPGKDALSHDIYFGTDFNDVNDADIYDANVYMGNQDVNYWDANNYYSNGLDFGTTYYWRIDEISAAITTKGDIWTFRTLEDIPPNLVDWWKFDEGTGIIAYDSAGTNNGTIYGAAWTTGKIAGALSFNGTSNYVDCGSGPSNYDNITVSAWMKTSTDGVLVSNRDSGGSYGTWYTLSSTNIELGDNSQGGYRHLYFNTNTVDNVWHHVAYTKNGTSHAIYVDGVLDQSFTANADISQAYPMFIGRRWTRSNGPSWFNGTIDDVRVYNRALSAAEVWQLYQSGL